MYLGGDWRSEAPAPRVWLEAMVTECLAMASSGSGIDGRFADQHRFVEAGVCQFRFGLFDRAAITQADDDSDDLPISREVLPGAFLESLHGIHEFHLVIGVLLVECRRIDAAAPIFPCTSLGPSVFRRGPLRDGRGTARLGWRADLVTSIPPGPPLVEKRIERITRKIEFRTARSRLIIVLAHSPGRVARAVRAAVFKKLVPPSRITGFLGCARRPVKRVADTRRACGIQYSNLARSGAGRTRSEGAATLKLGEISLAARDPCGMMVAECDRAPRRLTARSITERHLEQDISVEHRLVSQCCFDVT
jgi:hypothetical protein